MSQSIVGDLAVQLGVTDAQLQAGLAQAVTQAQQAGQKMAQAVNQGQKMGGGIGLNPQGLLNISRAIDDVQYGFRGIVNNIEGIVTGLGYGAGVAGAATIAAVALNMMAPAIETAYSATLKFFGMYQSEAEKARNSVTAFMTAGGKESAMASVLKGEMEFLKQRNALGQTSRIGFGRIGDFIQGMQIAATEDLPLNATLEDFNRVLQQRRSVEASAKFQQAAQLSAEANQQSQFATRGAIARFDLTTAQTAQIPINREVFQAAIDKYGGGAQLRDRLSRAAMATGLNRSQGQEIYGGFASGDLQASDKAIRLLNLRVELQKAIANDYERATGSAEEFRRIEAEAVKTQEETAKFIEQEQRWMEKSLELDEEREKIRQSRILDRQFSEYQQAVNRQDDLFRQRDDILMQRSRSEILGSAAEVFNRNINAGQEDPQLKKLDEIKEEIKNLGTQTGLG